MQYAAQRGGNVRFVQRRRLRLLVFVRRIVHRGGGFKFFLNKYFTFKVKEWKAHIVILFALNIAVSYVFAYGLARPAVSLVLNGTNSKLMGNISLVQGCAYTQ
jgi:hypothetical protein